MNISINELNDILNKMEDLKQENESLKLISNALFYQTKRNRTQIINFYQLKHVNTVDLKSS